MGAASEEQQAVNKTKKAKIAVDAAQIAGDAPAKKVKKEKKKLATGEQELKKKKRKADDQVVDIAENERRKKKKKQKVEDEEPSIAASDSADSEQFVEVAKPADPLALDNFRLSDPVKALLREKGIEALFNIQAHTLNHVLDGFDLVGRARCASSFLSLHHISGAMHGWSLANIFLLLHASLYCLRLCHIARCIVAW